MRMKTTLMGAVAALCFLAGQARAASFTVPSFTLTGPPSTGTVCTPIASRAAPVAAGTILSTCTVSPAGWVGGVSLSDNILAVVNLSGATFNIAVGAAALSTPGNYGGETGTTAP